MKHYTVVDQIISENTHVLKTLYEDMTNYGIKGVTYEEVTEYTNPYTGYTVSNVSAGVLKVYVKCFTRFGKWLIYKILPGLVQMLYKITEKELEGS